MRQGQAGSDAAAFLRADSMPAALGTPPWAMSLAPPPRPPSFDIVCFIRAPISWGSPADWAKTNDGCGDVLATRATTFDARRVNFWARSLREFMSRSAKVRTTSLRALDSG